MKKVIGITVSRHEINSHTAQFTHEEYIRSIEEAGGIAIMLPITDHEKVLDQVELIDGLLMSGGIDVDPSFYNEEKMPKQGKSDKDKDRYEIELIHECVKKQIPILGICRGMQIINVALGGSMYQDNVYKDSSVKNHTQKESRDTLTHLIQIDNESYLYPLFGKETQVNSFHHQSVHKLGKGLKAIAFSPDGLIEGIQHEKEAIFGVQFHPECMTNAEVKKLFQYFIKICKEKRV